MAGDRLAGEVHNGRGAEVGAGGPASTPLIDDERLGFRASAGGRVRTPAGLRAAELRMPAPAHLARAPALAPQVEGQDDLCTRINRMGAHGEAAAAGAAGRAAAEW